MTDRYEPLQQRAALLAFVRTLGCRDSVLRRDDCGDWRVNGKRGHIYATPGVKAPGFQIHIQCETAREWSYAKKALKPFTDLANDGDEEGILLLDRLPAAQEAETLRQYVEIAKKRENSEDERARLVGMGHRFERRTSSEVEGRDQLE